MSFAERIWWILTMAAVLWYSTITIYVAIRGAIDIRQMLKRLEENHRSSSNISK